MEIKSIILALLYIAMLIDLILIAIIDMKQKIISQKLLLILLAGSTAVVCTSDELSLLSSFTSMAFMFFILSLIYYITKKAIGWGDVKLCSCIAPYFGIERAFAMLFISMILCGFLGLVLVAMNKENRSRPIAFAPFVAVGTILVILF